PAPAEPPANAWAPPAAAPDQWGTKAPPAPASDRCSAPPAQPATPAAADDPWGTRPTSAPVRDSWAPPAEAPSPAKDAWAAPAPAQKTWTAPSPGAATSVDPWGSPPSADPRTAAFRIPEHGSTPVEEWRPPPKAQPAMKMRGLVGIGRYKLESPPI